LVGFVLFVPNGYVSDSPLSDTSTYDNQTFVTLGATPGTYVWTWGSGADADSFTLDIGTIAPILPTKTLPTESCPINIIRGFLVLACYEFSDAPSSHLFDPATASGYAYQMTDGSLLPK
jgi:hypothetical protein